MFAITLHNKHDMFGIVLNEKDDMFAMTLYYNKRGIFVMTLNN